MKLVLAIINNDDCPVVTEKLTEAGFYTTKIASTGGFLKAGNTTFISGVEDDKVDQVIDVISKYSRKRYQPFAMGGGVMHGAPIELMSTGVQQVLVGGATVFVLGVERFEHV